MESKHCHAQLDNLSLGCMMIFCRTIPSEIVPQDAESNYAPNSTEKYLDSTIKVNLLLSFILNQLFFLNGSMFDENSTQIRAILS